MIKKTTIKNIMTNNCIESSEIYFINPKDLRKNNVELMKRNREKAYGESHPNGKNKSIEQRLEEYDKLKDAINKNGFSPDKPIVIMLRRKNGKDKILEGHHRLAIAIDLGLDRVPVKFVCKNDKI